MADETLPANEAACQSDVLDVFSDALPPPKRGGRKPKYTLKDMQAVAAQRGGVFVSAEFNSANKRHEWRCGFGHRWSAAPVKIINEGTWCPECCRIGSSRGERITREILERMFKAAFRKRRPEWLKGVKGRALELDGYAEELGIAFEYQGSQHYAPENAEQRERDALKVRHCQERGVRLIVVPDFTDNRNLSGCIDQIEHAVLWAGLAIPRKWKRPKSLAAWTEPLAAVFGASRVAMLRAAATDRGGSLISETAENTHSRLEWECSEGHRWRAVAASILRGTWCPVCSGRLSLDIEICRRIAGERGGACLSTEYINNREKLKWECAVGHRWDAALGSVKAGRWCNECAKLRTHERLIQEAEEKGFHIQAMKDLAAQRGGKCLSVVYLGTASRMEWECGQGHKWAATPSSLIYAGSWCPYCAGKAGRGLHELQKIAAERGGACLSTEYLGTQKKHQWQCAVGHTWSAVAASVKSGAWCPDCQPAKISETKLRQAAAKGLDIDRMREIARQRGGQCLSGQYAGTQKRLEWACAEGHRWEAIPASLLYQGTWCPYCSGRYKWTEERTAA